MPIWQTVFSNSWRKYQVQDEFDEDTYNKWFLKSLSKIFALLLNTKSNTAKKIKIIIKVALETTVNIWLGQN